MEIEKTIARRIVETVGANGIPPEGGFEYFSYGLDNYLKLFENEYFKDFIKNGGSSFKMILGAYGGGKTHFLYSLRDIAWKNNFVVSYVSLSVNEAPLAKLELVYRAIMANCMYSNSLNDVITVGIEKGIGPILTKWYHDLRSSIAERNVVKDEEYDLFSKEVEGKLEIIENVNFRHAISAIMENLFYERLEKIKEILQWLTGSGYEKHVHKEYNILYPITRTNAFSMIRSLVQFIRSLGYSGLIILFDEAESIPSISTREKDLMLSNLRELIDSCAQVSFSNVMLFYAVCDENFLEGKTHIYEALKQRTSSVFSFVNPSGVKINLEDLHKNPTELLIGIGKNLSQIYEHAYDTPFKNNNIDELIKILADSSFERRFGDIGYKRLFVQGAIKLFHYMRFYPDTKLDVSAIHKLLDGETL